MLNTKPHIDPGFQAACFKGLERDLLHLPSSIAENKDSAEVFLCLSKMWHSFKRTHYSGNTDSLVELIASMRVQIKGEAKAIEALTNPDYFKTCVEKAPEGLICDLSECQGPKEVATEKLRKRFKAALVHYANVFWERNQFEH